jgi:serine/threonine protein phosphatase PrpC
VDTDMCPTQTRLIGGVSALHSLLLLIVTYTCFSCQCDNWDQVSRSIGDGFLKRSEFSFDPSFLKFHLSDPIRLPVLSAEPSMCSIVLQPNDQFIIFASDGLWEHMTNQEAAEIVHNNPKTICFSFQLILN